MSIKKMSESTLTNSGRYSDMSMGEVGWGAASGGTEVTSGGYKYHTFTTDGTLTVTTPGKFDCLLVAGGGGGGSSSSDAGGAGGVHVTCAQFEAGAVAVDIGSGGVGGFGRNVFASGGVAQGNIGYATYLGDLYAVGGGGGGRTTSGGSGGATNGKSIEYQLQGGFASGVLGSASVLGKDGGDTAGGGAGEVGGTSALRNGGDGTDAFTSWAAATSTGENDGTGTYYYAGGGGGNTVTSRGSGGLGGGGNGGSTSGENDNVSPTAGLANTGGGGGAGFSGYENRIIGGANGGSGLVIVRYEV